MTFLFELIIGIAFGLEYFDEGDAYILSVGLFRVIILMDDE